MGRGLTPASRSDVDRASPTDVTNLAVDRGPCPMNIAAVLVVEGGEAVDLPTLRGLLEQRLPRVRRMRQRLVPAPPGCGRPYWVDATDFDLGRHLTGYQLGSHQSDDGGGDDRVLLRAAADLVCTPLPRDRPLWRARWITGLDGGRAALVLVVHHVMADGIGGLAVLAALADGDPPARPHQFPEPPPTAAVLAADAFRGRRRALAQARSLLGRTRHGLRELGLSTGRPELAPTTSLNRPTGPRRRLTTVTVPLAPVVELGHARGCTVNDVVLTAIAGALAGTLRRRGEHPDRLVMSVPISSRRGATADRLGNETGVVPMTLPTTADPNARLAEVARISRGRRSGPRGASAAPMGLVFRGLGRLGLFQAFIDRQRLVNTFVTNVRGPSESLLLGGHRVSKLVPVAVNPGNVGVSFDVMSYAGRLGVTLVADPDVVPDQDELTALLEDELAYLLGGSPSGSSGGSPSGPVKDEVES